MDVRDILRPRRPAGCHELAFEYWSILRESADQPGLHLPGHPDRRCLAVHCKPRRKIDEAAGQSHPESRTVHPHSDWQCHTDCLHCGGCPAHPRRARHSARRANGHLRCHRPRLCLWYAESGLELCVRHRPALGALDQAAGRDRGRRDVRRRGIPRPALHVDHDAGRQGIPDPERKADDRYGDQLELFQQARAHSQRVAHRLYVRPGRGDCHRHRRRQGDRARDQLAATRLPGQRLHR